MQTSAFNHADEEKQHVESSTIYLWWWWLGGGLYFLLLFLLVTAAQNDFFFFFYFKNSCMSYSLQTVQFILLKYKIHYFYYIHRSVQPLPQSNLDHFYYIKQKLCLSSAILYPINLLPLLNNL